MRSWTTVEWRVMLKRWVRWAMGGKRCFRKPTCRCARLSASARAHSQMTKLRIFRIAMLALMTMMAQKLVCSPIKVLLRKAFCTMTHAWTQTTVTRSTWWNPKPATWPARTPATLPQLCNRKCKRASSTRTQLLTTLQMNLSSGLRRKRLLKSFTT